MSHIDTPVAPTSSAPRLPGSAGNTATWCNIANPTGLAWALHQAHRQHQGPMLIIADDTQTAVQLEQDLRFFTDEHTEVLLLPDWETLPYDSFSPHQDIVSQRITTLFNLPRMRNGLLIVPISTLMQRIAPPGFLNAHSLILDVGQALPLEATRRQLEQSGYQCVDTVMNHGEFALRGSILDIFPMGSELPYRIELLDDEIDTLRTFDPDSQRTLDKVSQIRLLPGKEFPFDAAGRARFLTAFKEAFDVDHRACPVYMDVNQQLVSAGIEYYLPLFHESTATLFDYLPSDVLCAFPASLDTLVEHFWQECANRYEELRHDRLRPLLPPIQLFLPVDEVFRALNAHRKLRWQRDTSNNARSGYYTLPQEPGPELPADAKASQPLARLESYLQQARNSQAHVLFCVESAGRKETLMELLARIGERPQPINHWVEFSQGKLSSAITIAPLANGLELTAERLYLITESQLFGQRVMQQRRRRKSDDHAELMVRNLTELKLDAPVVHLDHGVGRYKGLHGLDIDGQQQEFLMLEYANNAKLYVPVGSLHLIHRYSGMDEAHAPLHRLGTDQWQKEKRKAAEKVNDVAAELLNIYARRAARQGYAFPFNQAEYEIFSAGFPFEETPDQQLAIAAVIKDMTAKQPMDRLVCGDVGFGKTEVAMRAAFVAINAGRQVAVLVPTTLLAQQHFDTFKDRFAEWPVNIEVLSRFRSAADQKRALSQLEAGKIDILVGTHKLLQSGIQFRDLGLVIVDEEHRFGVRDKEKLKMLRADVDMLTLTATPIPRTLNMAMSGMRDMSIIATPPARRLSIKTFVRENNNPVLKEAIMRELLRGGQVYLLHNEVKSIERRANEIQQLVPEARIAIAHGQLRERELEQVMSSFYHKRFNVLVCTTIIETGIDVPSANTIIIDRADKLGLAQLHQLRGRVGRSHHQAYAYLLTPNPKALTADAKKRLEAIAEAQDLGAGFTLASHDLEIRGAGELLGDEQSGNMQSVGFSLYMEMLEQAVKAIREGKTPNLDTPLQHGAEINLRVPALIREDYLPDVHMRLIMYKRIANATDDGELDDLRAELIDRFGSLPEATQNLFQLTRLKLKAQALGIDKIDAHDKGGRVEFGSQPKVEPLTLVKLIQQQPQFYRLEGADKLRFMLDLNTTDERFQQVEALLDRLRNKHHAH